MSPAGARVADLHTSCAAAKTPDDAKLAYSHTLTLDLAAERLAAHFAVARNLLLDYVALRCLLVCAMIEQDLTGATRPHGQIEVRLPHGAVPVYVREETAAPRGEPPAAVVVRARGRGRRT
ncbi:MAG: hypothetical protein J0H14_06860 [Alphaproteobacteria bacterium]|nr:hypothetical protein [Alphaproteobacteria bacterium]